ncbi:MAG: hypothetical protein AABM43_02385 [Actinomycetota bacterium]
MIRTDASTFSTPAANGTIFDRFDQFGVDWKVYYDSLPAPLVIPGVLPPSHGQHPPLPSTGVIARRRRRGGLPRT